MAPRSSAGLLVFRKPDPELPALQVLLVHPGGPFWSKKDAGAWFIPKGEINPDEEPLAAAQREFHEELGVPPPAAPPLALGSVKNKSGKLIQAWALPGDVDLSAFKSNTFLIEWPPRSGKQQAFPEVDRACYFSVEEARSKLHPAELPLLQRLLEAVLGS